MYALLEFADHGDMYRSMNNAIPPFIPINKENISVKSSTLSDTKTVTALKAKAPAAKKNKNKVDDKTQNYTQTETMGFLCLMEEIKPIGSEEWDLLVRRQAEAFLPGCDINYIRRKYASCHQKSHPTGAPYCPEEVRRLAKWVKYLIGDWANIGDGTEVYDLVSGEHKDKTNAAVGNPPPPPVAQQEEVPPAASKKEEVLVPLKELDQQAAPVSK